MNDQHRLTEALRHRADDIHDGHPFGLTDVQGKARSIRRRRAAASGLAVAAVLAVAVPAGIAVNDRVSGSADGQVATTPSADPTKVPGRVDGVLTTDAPEGTAPGLPYLVGDSLRLPDGTEIGLEQEYDGIAALQDGWFATDFGSGRAALLDADGTVVRSMDSTGSVAVSDDGTIVAHVTPDGRIVTIGTDGNDVEMPRPESGGEISVAGIIGSETCREESEGGGCALFFTLGGQEQQGRHITSHGIGDQLDNLLTIGGISVDGRVSGVVSADDYGSCSAVLGVDWTQEWRTCDHTVTRFSPDGRYVIGRPAYLDGIGDASLAILDAKSGQVLAEWGSTEETQAFISNAVWDDDGTVLATVFEKDSWSLMRMSPDGTLTNALADLGTDMDEVPLRLPAAP